MFTFSFVQLVFGSLIGSVDGVPAFVVAVVANTILYRINDTQKWSAVVTVSDISLKTSKLPSIHKYRAVDLVVTLRLQIR